MDITIKNDRATRRLVQDALGMTPDWEVSVSASTSIGWDGRTAFGGYYRTLTSTRLTAAQLQAVADALDDLTTRKPKHWRMMVNRVSFIGADGYECDCAGGEPVRVSIHLHQRHTRKPRGRLINPESTPADVGCGIITIKPWRRTP